MPTTAPRPGGILPTENLEAFDRRDARDPGRSGDGEEALGTETGTLGLLLDPEEVIIGFGFAVLDVPVVLTLCLAIKLPTEGLCGAEPDAVLKEDGKGSNLSAGRGDGVLIAFGGATVLTCEVEVGGSADGVSGPEGA